MSMWRRQVQALIVELDGGQLIYPDESLDDCGDRLLTLLEDHGRALSKAEKLQGELTDAEDEIKRMSEILEKNGIKNF